MARLIVMRKGGGEKVAVNPEHVTHVRSACGAFTDIFMGNQQIAVENTFDEVLARLTTPDPRPAGRKGDGNDSGSLPRHPDDGFIFGRLGQLDR